MHPTGFWSNLHQLVSSQKIAKSNKLKVFWEEENQRSKEEGQTQLMSHMCMMVENPNFNLV